MPFSYSLPSSLEALFRHSNYLHVRQAPALRFGASFSGDVFCARNLGLAASTNRRLALRTFGSMQAFLHHNSYEPGMARIIVLVTAGLSSGGGSEPWAAAG